MKFLSLDDFAENNSQSVQAPLKKMKHFPSPILLLLSPESILQIVASAHHRVPQWPAAVNIVPQSAQMTPKVQLTQLEIRMNYRE